MELRVFVEPQEGASYEDQLAAARAAERLGYGAFFRSDHLLAIVTADPLPGPSDSWVALGAIARETSSIRLGTLVSSATFRAPTQIAMQAAQVDAMSAGRVELGLGAGWYEAEHLAFGLPFPSQAERFERLAEQLEIVRRFWETPAGETFSFEGVHYRLSDCPGLPKPSQRTGPGGRPGPPIIIGGTGPRRTPALAARYADEINAFAPPERCREQYRRVAEACARIDRDPSELVRSAAVRTCCATSEAELALRAERIGFTVAELRATGYALLGTPAEVLETLEAYREAGAERVYLQFADITDLDQIELIAAEVMPQLG